MKRKLFAVLLTIILPAVFGNPAMASDNLFPVGSDLSVPVYCARYQNIAYGFTLRYAPIPLDGLYWKMDIGTFTQVTDTQTGCLEVGADVALNLSVIYQDVVYDVVLRYFPYADGELYWKVDADTFQKRDSLAELSADMVRADSEGNADLMGTRISASYLYNGMDYNCLMAYTVWDYSHSSYSDVAYAISGIVYENLNGKSLAKFTRTKTATEHPKNHPTEAQSRSDTGEKVFVFENGKWRLYGNQQRNPGVSASEILTCTGLDQTTWEPIGATDIFTSSNLLVGIFAEIQNVYNGANYQFRLFRPNGTFVYESDKEKFDWGDYPPCVRAPASVYYSIYIEKNEAFWNASPGQWKVEVYVDGQKAGEVYFEYR